MAQTARPAPAGLLTRVVGGLRQAWFGPSQPLAPEAPPDTAGRQFDYPVGFNLRLQPRQDEGTSFADLRGLADAYDLVRLVIETRKDQIEALDWQIRPRRGGSPDDPRIAAIEDLLRAPDREHPWGTWVRLLLEDLFVLDAPTLYVRRTASGALWGLEVIDGATIKRLLGPDGRTPRAPDPAYQQVLKGIPAVDYSADELIYAPRNPRPHKVYGYSPVEQILMTVNIGLRRQVSQLNYFTEGNTPEALIGVPEAWTPDQIRQFQEYWDALLEGNLAARRHTRFVPGGLKYQPIRDVPLKDDFDEWLARVVCFAFSLPPTAFTKQTNRATAEASQDAATAEGLQPLLSWLKGLIDRIIVDVLGCPDLEFAWADRTAPDPETQATIAAAYVAAGIKTRNEVRAELGLDPILGGDVLTTATPAVPLPQGMAKAGYNPDQARDAKGRWSGGLTESDWNTSGTRRLPSSDGTDIHASGRLIPAQEILPFDDFVDGMGAFSRPPISLEDLPEEVLNQPRETVPRLSGKEGAKDVPSWAQGERPMIRENGADFARRLMDDQYGEDQWENIPKRMDEFKKIRKWGDRNFQIPRSALKDGFI